jgi:hypothetical protein
MLKEDSIVKCHKAKSPNRSLPIFNSFNSELKKKIQRHLSCWGGLMFLDMHAPRTFSKLKTYIDKRRIWGKFIASIICIFLKKLNRRGASYWNKVF